MIYIYMFNKIKRYKIRCNICYKTDTYTYITYNKSKCYKCNYITDHNKKYIEFGFSDYYDYF